MRTGWGKASVLLLMGLAMSASSRAGTLAEFEDAVAEPGKKKQSRHYSDDDHEHGIGIKWVFSGTYYACKWVVYDWWAKPDAEDFYSDEAVGEYEVPETEGFGHEFGSPGLPYARFDYRWQYLDHDLDANDYLLEVGYKYVAAYARITQYEDRTANERLDIEQYYGMARIGGSDEFFFDGSFQFGIGFGGYIVDGPGDRQSGVAATVPILIYPNEWMGFEFRPAWTQINQKTISDYDISVAAGYKFTHLRLGYRWLYVQHEGPWLDGPYAGISFSF